MRFPAAAAAEEETPDGIVYNRIWKCSGSTMVPVLRSVATATGAGGRRYVHFDWQSAKRPRQALMPQDIRAYMIQAHDRALKLPMAASQLQHGRRRLFVISGHAYFVPPQAPASTARSQPRVNFNVSHIQVVRHPVDRWVSHFYYMRKTFPNDPKVQNSTLEDAHFCVLIRFFCGYRPVCEASCSDGALALAKENACRYYGVVGITSNLAATWRLLQRVYPTYFADAPGGSASGGAAARVQEQVDRMLKRVVNRNHYPAPSAAARDHLSRALAADIHFYEWLHERFWEQSQVHGLPRQTGR